MKTRRLRGVGQQITPSEKEPEVPIVETRLVTKNFCTALLEQAVFIWMHLSPSLTSATQCHSLRFMLLHFLHSCWAITQQEHVEPQQAQLQNLTDLVRKVSQVRKREEAAGFRSRASYLCLCNMCVGWVGAFGFSDEITLNNNGNLWWCWSLPTHTITHIDT